MDHLTHYLQIVFLGIIEGATEFLPISPTGHLFIAERLLGSRQPDIFNVVLRTGAVLAVLFIYWHKLMALFGNLQNREARAYLAKIFISFVVTLVLCLVIAKFMGQHRLTESLANFAWSTLIGGLIIFAIEFLARDLYPHEDISWFEAILVGCAQVLAAIFPGISRSGATIMSGLMIGIKRPTATEFSLLVGIPTLFAASLYAIVKDWDDFQGISDQLIIDAAIGFVVSGIVAFFVVKWLLRFVQSHTFNGFAVYRVLFGGGLLIALYAHAVPDAEGKEQNKPATAMLAPIAAPALASSETAVPMPTVNTEAAPVTTTKDNAVTNTAPVGPIYPQAQAVNPADLTNFSPATNVAILPPPAIFDSVPETNAPATPATNHVPASQN